MKVVTVLQARMGFTRLPEIVMKSINEMPLIELLDLGMTCGDLKLRGPRHLEWLITEDLL